MIDDENSEEGDLLLHSEDFPSIYKNMAHPDDYIIRSSFIKNEYLIHHKKYHNRLIFRTSFKLDNQFMPISFVVDTGAPMCFYLSDKAMLMLQTRIQEDELQSKYISIQNKKASVQETPSNHKPANIIGLLMIERLGMTISSEGMRFLNCPDYF